MPNRRQLISTLEWREEMADRFRDLWYTEYLIGLREAGQEVLTQGWENRIKTGDVVLIEHPERPRPFWQLGRVVDLLPGRDGVVRCVRLVKPDRSTSVYSINQLYPLEISVAAEIEELNRNHTPAAELNPAREPRKAALKCVGRIRKRL